MRTSGRTRRDRSRPAGTRSWLAGAVVVASATFGIGLGIPAPPAAASGSCHTSEEQVTASYDTRWDNTGSVVRAVTLSGFPARCDGDTVVLQLWGNDEGDPSVPQSDDALLATANSALAPCDQSALASPLTISSGTIELHLCREGGAAGEVLLHDLTLLTLSVNGEPVSVGAGGNADTSGQPVPVDPAGDPSTAAATQPANALASIPSVKVSAGGTGVLAFTGAAVWVLLACGLAGVSGGLILLVLGRLGRRRRSEAGST